MNKHLLSREEAAKFLGIKPETLNAWSHHKRYNLPYVKVGRCVRYKYSDLLEFIEKRTQKSGEVENEK